MSHGDLACLDVRGTGRLDVVEDECMDEPFHSLPTSFFSPGQDGERRAAFAVVFSPIEKGPIAASTIVPSVHIRRNH
jgi:hypothetical protein